MIERATVVKTSGKIAVLQIYKHAECEGCKICAFSDGKSTVKVKALNTAQAKVGDDVVVRAEKDNRLLASFIVYIIPVLTAAAGALIGAFACKSEPLAAILAVAGLIAGFAIVYAVDKIVAKSRGFGMEVVRICKNKDENDLEEENSDSEI